MHSLDPKGTALAFLMAFIFGIGWVISKYSLNEFPPILFATFRFGVTALFLIWFTKFPRAHIREIFIISTITMVIPSCMTYTGLKLLDVSTTILILQMEAPIVIIMGAIFLGERPNEKKIIGILISFSGVIFIFGNLDVSENYFAGLIIFIGIIIWGFGQIKIRRLDSIDSMTKIVWISALSTPQLLIATYLFEDNQIVFVQNADWMAWAMILYVGMIMTPIGNGLWYKLTHDYTFANVAPFLLLIPVISITGGVIILGEELSIRFIIGAILILFGIGIILLASLAPKVAKFRDASKA